MNKKEQKIFVIAMAGLVIFAFFYVIMHIILGIHSVITAEVFPTLMF